MESKTVSGLVVAVLVAVVLVGGLFLWLLGDTLRELARVLVWAVAAALVIVAASFPIRQWRRSDAQPIVREVIKQETRILDGRQAPVILPQPGQQPWGLFPEILRASYRAGRLAEPEAQPQLGQPGAHFESMEVELEPTDDAWTGRITP